jgi:hypothetical protein
LTLPHGSEASKQSSSGCNSTLVKDAHQTFTEKIISLSPQPLSFSTGEKLEIKQLVQQGVVYLILSEINRKASLNQPNAV